MKKFLLIAAAVVGTMLAADSAMADHRHHGHRGGHHHAHRGHVHVHRFAPSYRSYCAPYHGSYTRSYGYGYPSVYTRRSVYYPYSSHYYGPSHLGVHGNNFSFHVGF